MQQGKLRKQFIGKPLVGRGDGEGKKGSSLPPVPVFQ